VKIFALEHERAGATKEMVHFFAQAQAARGLELYHTDVLREIYYQLDETKFCADYEEENVNDFHNYQYSKI
jgi:hypothetical protein